MKKNVSYPRGETEKLLLGAEKEKMFSVTDIILIAVIVLVLCFSIVQRVWISPVNISGDSMNRTIDDNDWLLMDKFASPDFGDVVVIEITGETNYIKRVIGLPGDELFMEDGVVYRRKNGEENFSALDEPYAYYSRSKKGMNFGPVKVGEGKIFVLGDNRCDSRDSRQIGAKNISDVLGVVPEWSIKNKKTITAYYSAVLKADNFILNLFGISSCNGRV